MKKAYKFGGEYVYFSPEEQKSLKDFGSPVVRIIGFKSRRSIPLWGSVKKSTFIYPSEEDYVGSTRVFTALWQKLLKDDKIALAWCVVRSNANPMLAAIMPSKPQSDEDSGTPFLPAGLWLYPLPFADDLRDIKPPGKLAQASDDLKTQMRIIIQQLQLPKAMYNPTKYPNPSLQWHYKILQALALEEEVPETAEDTTLPKFKAISKRAGGYLEEWSETLSTEATSATEGRAVKREIGDELPERPAKRGRTTVAQPGGPGLTPAQLKAAVDNGSISKMTVAQLKDVAGEKGLSTSGRKADIIERIEQWVEEN